MWRLSFLLILIRILGAWGLSPWPRLNDDLFTQPQHLDIFSSFGSRRHLVSTLDTNYPNHPAEILALSSLFASLQGHNWYWSSNSSLGRVWDFNSQPCADKWQRITCACVPAYGLCFVVKLELSQFNLNGTLSPDVKYLSQLVYLNLANNTLLRGNIPSEIAALTNLVYLSMYITRITGTIPSVIQNLQALQYLVLGEVIDFNAPIVQQNSENRSISGPYPAMLASLTSLRYLYLYGTQQGGTIPTTWSTMTQLNALVIGGSFLSGTIPSSIFSLTNLVYFVVGRSFMTGVIPSAIGNLIGCHVISINTNSFTSTIPDTISRLASIEYFYAEGNQFTGTIPLTISFLTKLKYLYLSENLYSGTIPAALGRLTQLELLSLQSNFLTFTIPPEIGFISTLEYLDISMNYLSGTIPMTMEFASSLKVFNATINTLTGPLISINALTQLNSLDLSANLMTGSLPDNLSRFAVVEYLQLRQNYINGRIPSWIGKLRALICLDLSANELTGPMPTSLSNLVSLVYLDFSSNSLSSSIPVNISRLSSLQYFILEASRITGMIPDEIGQMTSLRSIRFKKNFLSGTLSQSVSSLQDLEMLDLSENKLSGSLLNATSALSNLKYLLLHNNLFNGDISNIVAPHTQKSLRTIDLSDNSFTGTIPDSVYTLISLQHFAAAVNCLHGTLKPNICSAREMVVLALDGVGASTQCQQKYLPWISSVHSYGLLQGLHGTIPSCLFEMKSLDTLHLSGNLLSGSLSQHMNISPSLHDISLSHNLLTGSIPINIQQRNWVNLDLSFNRFYGSLSDNFAAYDQSSSLRLMVNRLSGKVPKNVQQAYNVSVLDGNLFECNVYNGDKGLPKHDSATGVYQCADSFQQLSYTWASPYIFFVVLAAVGFCVFSIWKSWSDKVYQVAEAIDKYMGILDRSIGSGRTSSILLFKKFLVDWQVTSIFISAFNVLIVLPVWIVLTVYYNTYQYEYSWSASVAYLSGLVPAIVALVMFTLLLATVFSLSTTNTARHKSRRISNFVAVELPEKISLKLCHYLTLLVITLFNCVIVIGVNVLYVLATNNFNKTVVTLCALAVAFFKFTWNLIILVIFESLEAFVSPSIPAHVLKKFQHRNLISQCIIGLINSILIPLLSTAALSSTCYYYLFQDATPIRASFQYSECVVQTILVYTCQVLESVVVCNNVEGLNYQCLGESSVQRSTSFYPPFTYSYQCSSTFIASYAAVYVYTYMVVAIIGPMTTYLLLKLRQCLSSKSKFRPSIDFLLPKFLVPISEDRVIDKKLFNRNFFVTSAITDTAALITFGAIFPPLSFVICIAIVIRAFLILYGLGRMLLIAEEKQLPAYSHQLLQDCADIPEIFGKLLWLILPFAALIYSLFILDTYGDEVYWKKALIPTLVMCAVPFLFLLLSRLYRLPSVKSIVDYWFDWTRDHIPMAKVLLKARPQDLGLRATVIVNKSARLSTIAFRKTVVQPVDFTTKESPPSGDGVHKIAPISDESKAQTREPKEDEYRSARAVAMDELVDIEDL